MTESRVCYVEFLCPGALMSETSCEEVSRRDAAAVEVPENAFAFRFFDRMEAAVDADGKERMMRSERFNYSPTYYPGGKAYTLAKLELHFPEETTLLSNARSNKWLGAIRTRIGNWQPWEHGDVAYHTADGP